MTAPVTDRTHEPGGASAVEGTDDLDETGWRGPLRPEGDDPHRYFFLLYAANQPLNLQPGATAEELREALDGKVIAAAS